MLGDADHVSELVVQRYHLAVPELLLSIRDRSSFPEPDVMGLDHLGSGAFGFQCLSFAMRLFVHNYS